MIKAVLFDLDGTLVNSISDLASSVNHALDRLGFPLHPTEEYKYLVGDGIPKLIERALPESERDSGTERECLELFMAHYRKHFADETHVYEGVEDLVSGLKASGIKTAVISNKAQEMTDIIVRKFFGDSFDVVTGKREGYPTKPDPKLTLEVISALGVLPGECILAGDSGMDAAAAVNSGAVPVGVLWGFRTKEELVANGAKYTVTNPSEITGIIKEINNGDSSKL